MLAISLILKAVNEPTLYSNRNSNTIKDSLKQRVLWLLIVKAPGERQVGFTVKDII